MFRTLMIVGLAAAPVLASAAPANAPPTWRTLAECAAGYHANAAIKDPTRPSSMASMISDQAGDYQKAAVMAIAGDLANAKRSSAYDKSFISTYVKRRTPAYAKMSRDNLDHFLDTCPQLPAPG